MMLISVVFSSKLLSSDSGWNDRLSEIVEYHFADNLNWSGNKMLCFEIRVGFIGTVAKARVGVGMKN